MPSTNDGACATSTGRPARSEAARGGAVSASAAKTGDLRTQRPQPRWRSRTKAHPRRREPRPARTSGSSSTISNPMVPLPAITPGSLTGCTRKPSSPGWPWSRSTAHHSVERYRHDGGSQPRDGVQLGRGSGVRHDHPAGNPAAAGLVRDPLGHVAGASGVDPPGQKGGVGQRHGVGGAPDLEGADGLQALKLEPDLDRSAGSLKGHQRRPDRGPGDASAGGLGCRPGRWDRAASCSLPRRCFHPGPDRLFEERLVRHGPT